MGALVLGALSFFVTAFSDEWGVRRKRPGAGVFFAAGSLLLTAATLWLLAESPRPAWPWAVLGGAVALPGLGLLLYTLFFALPRGGSKPVPAAAADKLPLVDNGVFALCRHPGVLWLGMWYLGVWIACRTLATGAAFFLFTGLDTLYVFWQDRCVFPQSIDDYAAYQARVPFLVPNRRSWHACFSTFSKP